MTLIDSTGTGAYLAVSVIFLTRSVGLPMATVGFGLSVAAAVALMTTVPVGSLADRFGVRRVLVIVCLWRAACFTAYPCIRDLSGFLVVVCLLGLVDRSAAPLHQALVGAAVPAPERVHTLAVMRALRNIGFTVGAGVGSVALAVDNRTGYAVALWLNAASFLVAAVVAGRLPLLPRVGTIRRTFSLQPMRDRPYLALAGLNGILALHTPLLSIGLPLWISEHTDMPRGVVAVLLAQNTVMAVALQVRASRGAEATPRATRCLKNAGLSLAACCMLLAAAPPLPTALSAMLLVAATGALTAGELWQSAGGSGLSFALARDDRQAAYLSVFWLGVGIQQVVAPIVLVTVMTHGTAGWAILAAGLVATAMAVPRVVGRGVRRREQDVEVAVPVSGFKRHTSVQQGVSS